MVKDVSKIAKESELTGHCYYEALRWESSEQLLIRIFGHVDENPSRGFAYYLSVDTRSGIATVVKKENDEPDLLAEARALERRRPANIDP